MSTTKKWMPLFSTQFLGVFNDNFLKNCIIFISVFWLAEEDQGSVIPIASALLVIPFVLFSPLAGKMAQTYSKQKIYEYAKLAEIPIMAVAVVGFYFQSLWGVMAALLLMGLQSALYAPSKYGLIRDVGGVEGLSFGVGSMELLTFLGVLIGQMIAGIVADLESGVFYWTGSVLMVFAVAGWISSKRIKANEEGSAVQNTGSAEPFTFIVSTFRWARQIKGLNTTIMGLGGFWLVAALIQMNILDHAPDVYGLTNTGTALVMSLVAVGIGLGCWVAGLISKNRVELGMVPIGGIGLSILLTIFATVELSLISFVICLFLAAFFSGFYKVPLSAWIQERVEGRKLGRALAFNQQMAFVFILMAAGIFAYVIENWDTYMVFVVLAGISWLMTLITILNIPAMMIRFVAYLLARFYFKFDVHGVENLPRKTGALVVANHISLLDPFLLAAVIPRMLRFVMDKGLYEVRAWKWLLKKLNMIPITRKLDKVKLEEFNQLCQAEVNAGHVLCIFPEGQISRVGHLLEFKKGIEHIASGVDAPIIPIQMEGVRGVALSFSIGSSKPITPRLRSFRRRISINVGEPLPANSSAFKLRQNIKELNTQTFGRRIKEYHTLIHYFKRSLQKHKDSVMVSNGTRSMTYSEVYEASQNRTGYWQRTDNLFIGLDLPESMEYGILQTSALLAGKVPVHFPPNMSREDREHFTKKFNIDLVVGIENREELKISKGSKEVKVAADDLCGVFFHHDESGWYPISLTHKNFVAAMRGLINVFKTPESSSLYSEFPISSSYGNLAKFWLPTFYGMTSHYLDSADSVVEKIGRGEIRNMFVTAETLSVLQGKESNHNWTKVESIIMGRDFAPADNMKSLSDRDIFVSTSYGVDRIGLVLAVNTFDYEVVGVGGGKPMLQEGSKGNSYGRALPGVAIKIIDEGGNELEKGESGRILVKGTLVENRDTVKELDENGWYQTEDSGFLDENGFLFLQ